MSPSYDLLVIKRSQAPEIDRLARDLLSDVAQRRQSAAARLAVIGAAAVRRLLEALQAAPDPRKAEVLGVLERIGTPRLLSAALPLADHASTSVARAAVAALVSLLDSTDERTSATALDALTRITLDDTRSPGVRLDALQGLERLGPEIARGLRQRLPAELTGEARARERREQQEQSPSDPGSSADLDAGHLQAWLARDGPEQPVTRLHDVLRLAKDRLCAERLPEGRGPWQLVRSGVHHALAARDSRLGIYDLRDALAEGGDALSVGVLAALARVGDPSCLEPLGGACHRTADPWTRTQLLAALRAIIARHGLTRRHAALKQLAARWPELIAQARSAR